MKINKMIKTLLAGCLVVLTVGCSDTQGNRCNRCKDLHEQIKYEQSIDGLNDIMEDYYNCPICND